MVHEEFRVPRSRAFHTHDMMREEVLQALEPLLFGSMHSAYETRAQLEHAFAQEMQQAHAIAVHSGTIGLYLMLRACGVKRGDEVITVSNSDISTTAAICHCGATPVLCDVLASDYTMDVSRVERLVTTRTRAVLPVDLHGHPANVKALRLLADHYHLAIVEDAALATGALDDGKPVGAFSDTAIFSFAPFKPLGCAGNGAMIVTNDDELAARLRLLVGYGHSSDHLAIPVGRQHYIAEGYNVPLDGLEAALLTVKLPHLAEWTARRRAVAQAYHDGLAGSAVICPTFRPESQPTFRSYTVRVKNQHAVYEHLRRAGVEVVLHYTPPAYRHPVYGGHLPHCDELPITDQLADELLCLPVTPELTSDEVNYAVYELRSQVEG
jgi:dTDP-4-amino-4,6-dideoxygalactose transaminase